MKLLHLDSYQDAYKKVVILAIIFVIIVSVTFIIAFFRQADINKQISESIVVIDTKGQVYPSTVMLAKDVRSFEYETHVKQFVKLFYEFDENTFRSNIENALYLIGDTGKELYNEYKDLDVEKTLIQKNLHYTVQISDINIDMNNMPISGTVSFIQTGHRAKGRLSRNVSVQFTIYDIDIRSKENSNGCKIGEWKIVKDNIVTEDSNE